MLFNGSVLDPLKIHGSVYIKPVSISREVKETFKHEVHPWIIRDDAELEYPTWSSALVLQPVKMLSSALDFLPIDVF